MKIWIILFKNWNHMFKIMYQITPIFFTFTNDKYTLHCEINKYVYHVYTFAWIIYNIVYCILYIVHCSGKCVQLCVVHLDKIVEAAEIFCSPFKTNFDGAIFEESEEGGIGVECSSGPKFKGWSYGLQKKFQSSSVTVLGLLAAQRAV